MMLLKLFLVFCVLLSIEVFSKDTQRRSKRSEERSNEQNFNKSRTDDENTETASPYIMNVLDPNNNPIGHLNLHLNGITNSLTQNEATLPNINILSNTPAQRAKLRSKAKKIRPPYNTSDNRNNGLSKNTSSRPKPKLDQANMNVSVLDSLSPNIILKKDSVNTQKEHQTLKDSTTDGGRILNYEDIVKALQKNLNLRQFNLTEPLERQRMNFDTNNGNKNNTEALTKKDLDFMNQDSNEISDRGYTIERLTELLLEQNNYLKQIIQTIVQRNNATRKVSSKRIHVILDVKDLGNKTVDIELKPIIKCEDNDNEKRIKTPITENRKWVKINTTENDVYSDGIMKYVPSATLDDHKARKSYCPYHYYNPVIGVSNQASIEYEPKKRQGNNNYWRNVTPQNSNKISLLRTHNKNITSKLSKVMPIDTPLCYHKTYFGVPTNNIRYYHGYFK